MKKFNIPSEIIDRFKIKNVKSGFGHDLNGFYCDIYLGNKKVGYLNDDGWGGEVEVNLTPDASNEIKTLFEKHKIAKLMFEKGGWNFLKSEKSISLNDQINEVISIMDFQRQIDKANKRFFKDQEKAICYGIDTTHYRSISWGKTPLKGLMQVGMRSRIQEYINTKIKPDLSEGETILNTNFEELGLVK